MGPETQHIPDIPKTLREFQSAVSPLKAVANITLKRWRDLIRTEDKDGTGSPLRIALASRAEGLLSDSNGSLVELIAVIEGGEKLNKYLADDVREIRHLVEFFEKDLVETLGQETVTAAIAVLRRIEDCAEVVAKKKEYEDTK